MLVRVAEPMFASSFHLQIQIKLEACIFAEYEGCILFCGCFQKGVREHPSGSFHSRGVTYQRVALSKAGGPLSEVPLI